MSLHQTNYKHYIIIQPSHKILLCNIASSECKYYSRNNRAIKEELFLLL